MMMIGLIGAWRSWRIRTWIIILFLATLYSTLLVSTSYVITDHAVLGRGHFHSKNSTVASTLVTLVVTAIQDSLYRMRSLPAQSALKLTSGKNRGKSSK